jgi:MFS family permease
MHTSKGVILLLSCAAQFMVVLDVAIVNVALPSIQRDLGIGQSAVQWIVVAYGLMLAFHAAYWVIVAIAALGALTAAMAFPWRAARKTGPVRYRPATSRS